MITPTQPPRTLPTLTPQATHQCPQCGMRFLPSTEDEWECPECGERWAAECEERWLLAYPGVLM